MTTSAIAQLFDSLNILFWQVFTTFLRVGAVFAFLPGFGETVLAMRFRLILALAVAVVLTPVVNPIGIQPTLAVGAREFLIGAVMGLNMRFMAQALVLAGSIAGQATSLAQLFGSSVGDGPQPVFGTFLYWSGLAFLMLTDFPLFVITAFVDTYDILPIGAHLEAEWTANWAIGAVAHSFALGFTLSAPFLLAALIYNLAMGVINKAMPQLMVSFVGAPAITAGALILLALSATLILTVWQAQVLNILEGVYHVR